VRHGIGTFVKQDPISKLKKIDQNNEVLINPFELLEARRVIEVELVSLATKRATEQEIAEMEKALEALKQNVEEGRHAFDLDRKVHLAFARGGNNQILYRTMVEITEQMNKQLWIIMKDKSLEVLGRSEQYHKEHETIFNAIKNRDSKMATQAMLVHLKNIERAFLQNQGV